MLKKRIRLVLVLFLAAIFLVSLGMTIRRQLEYQESADAQDEAKHIVKLHTPVPAAAEPPAGQPEAVQLPGDPYAAALAEIDLSALQAENSDVIGWIEVPGTELSYPLLQAEDNQYYLKRTWKKWSNSGGSIFMECTNSPDLSDFHTIIYGHRMINDTMFGTLKYYKELEYCQAHPSVYIVTEEAVYRYDVFASFQASVRSMVYQLDLSEQEEEFIQFCLENSVVDTGVRPEAGEQILTLSTCTGGSHANRWIVQSVLRDTLPKAK